MPTKKPVHSDTEALLAQILRTERGPILRLAAIEEMEGRFVLDKRLVKAAKVKLEGDKEVQRGWKRYC